MDFEALRAVCLGFPAATQDLKWGEVTVFSVGGKMFAATNADLPARRISFKVDDDRFLELTDRPGIIPAPYMARLKWVYTDDPTAMSHSEASQLLRRSYELAFAKLTKKLQREIGELA